MTTRDERAERDQLIYRLHLAGISFRQIGKRIGLTPGAVHKVVRRELARAAELRDDLDGDADIEHLERIRQLLAVYTPKAQAGDLKAAEYCRRLLADMARVKGLNTSVAERIPPSRDRDADDDIDVDDVVINEDELAAWRKRREQPGYEKYAYERVHGEGSYERATGSGYGHDIDPIAAT